MKLASFQGGITVSNVPNGARLGAVQQSRLSVRNGSMNTAFKYSPQRDDNRRVRYYFDLEANKVEAHVCRGYTEVFILEGQRTHRFVPRETSISVAALDRNAENLQEGAGAHANEVAFLVNIQVQDDSTYVTLLKPYGHETKGDPGVLYSDWNHVHRTACRFSDHDSRPKGQFSSWNSGLRRSHGELPWVSRPGC